MTRDVNTSDERCRYETIDVNTREESGRATRDVRTRDERCQDTRREASGHVTRDVRTRDERRHTERRATLTFFDCWKNVDTILITQM